MSDGRRAADRATPRLDEFTVRPEPRSPGANLCVSRLDHVQSWCPKLGPTGTLLWSYLALRAEQPVTLVVNVERSASALGVAPHIWWRTVDRLVRLGIVRWVSGDVLEIRTHTNRPAPRPAP